jgi:CDP-diacylglycerol---glycerol-3-phosphate 3-phosphatidyltransferase
MTNASTEQAKAPITVTDRLRRAFQAPISGVARVFIHLGISANVITFVGFLINIIPAVLIAQGNYLAGGLVFMFSAPLDALDGAVARESGQITRFGALLDSTLDRYVESVLLGAMAYHLAQQGDELGVMLAFAALVGSLMVSYTRARSEGLLIDNKIGYFSRVERMILMVLGLITGKVILLLWILAIATQITVIQRMKNAYDATKDDGK